LEVLREEELGEEFGMEGDVGSALGEQRRDNDVLFVRHMIPFNKGIYISFLKFVGLWQAPYSGLGFEIGP
jgi:hypothetical protein